MLSKSDFLAAVDKEIDIIKHLYTKIPTDAFNYKPTEGQRTMLELLRYIAMCGSASTHVILNGSDWKLWKPYTEKIASMTAEQFVDAMEEERKEMRSMIESIPESDFHSKTVKHPAGEEMLLGLGLMRMPFSWLVAYRMQLFLYLKQLGLDIGTSNNWRGKDKAPPVAK